MAGLAARMSGGSEFHAAGPTCEKVHSPNLVHSRGIMYLLLEADRWPVRVPALLLDVQMMSLRYAGHLPVYSIHVRAQFECNVVNRSLLHCLCQSVTAGESGSCRCKLSHKLYDHYEQHPEQWVYHLVSKACTNHQYSFTELFVWHVVEPLETNPPLDKSTNFLHLPYTTLGLLNIETLVIFVIRHLMYPVADCPSDCTIVHLMQWCTLDDLGPGVAPWKLAS